MQVSNQNAEIRFFTSEVRFYSLYQAALYWISKGYLVLPVNFEGLPLTPHGWKDATDDPAIFSKWFSKEPIIGVPSVNIATVPKPDTGHFDMDVDRHGENGFLTLRRITKGKAVPRTLFEQSQSGGLHGAFIAPYAVKRSTGNVSLPGLDICGQGGYVIRSPSVRAKGAYHVFDAPIAAAPDWLLDIIEKPDKAEPEERREYDRPDVSGLNLADMINLSKFKKSGSRYIGPHPVHGSFSGSNFTVDVSRNIWHCFRKGHDSGGGPLQWIAVAEGIISCQDSKPGAIRGMTFWATIAAAHDRYGLSFSRAKEILQRGGQQ